MTKDELIAVIKANSQLDEEQLAKIAETIKGSVMEEFNEKLEKLIKANENKMTKVDPETKKDESKWNSFGELLQAVARVETRKEKDPRLVYEPFEKQLGMNEGVGAQGGFLVAPEFSKLLL